MKAIPNFTRFNTFICVVNRRIARRELIWPTEPNAAVRERASGEKVPCSVQGGTTTLSVQDRAP